MKPLVEYKLPDGTSVLVEVDQEAPAGMQPAGARTDRVIAAAQKTFESALDTIDRAASAVVARLRGLAAPPDEVQVESGVKMDLKGNAFVASAGTEASFKIGLTWKRKPE